jgi:hypothetical protein
MKIVKQYLMTAFLRKTRAMEHYVYDLKTAAFKGFFSPNAEALRQFEAG